MLNLGLAVAMILCAEPQDAGLKLTMAADKAEYILGEEVEAEVTLTNGGKESTEVGTLVFEDRSLNFDVTFEAGGTKKQFLYSVVRPDPHLAQRLAPIRFTLKPGKSLTGVFLVPTLSPGDLTLAAVYRGAEKQLRSSNVTVKVKATGEDGVERDAETIDTDGDGEQDVMWFPDDQMAGGGLGFPIK